MSSAVLLVFLIAASIAVVDSSSGDRSVEFHVCTAQCSQRDCDGTVELPFVLRLFGWSCFENCQYGCMHNVTLEDLARGRPVRQFFGKVRQCHVGSILD